MNSAFPFQCIANIMSDEYIDFPKENCPNVSSPCWIPQADNIIHEDIIHSLPQCDTVDKYACMLSTLKETRSRANKLTEKCMKSCRAETYDIDASRNNLNPFTSVIYNYINYNNISVLN